MTDRLDWQEYALGLARAASLRSEDPYVKVGACILRNDFTVASVGYNGVPSGIEIDWSDRESRRPKMIHAEANALRYVKPGEGYLLASTMMPCIECLKMTASYGISRIAYSDPFASIAYSSYQVEELAKEFMITLVHLPKPE